MTFKIKLSIQEIVNDFYSLAETEGYISGLAECGEIKKNELTRYHASMVNMVEKYIPNYLEKIDKRYLKNDTPIDEKGLMLSTLLYDNFKEIFYKLV